MLNFLKSKAKKKSKKTAVVTPYAAEMLSQVLSAGLSFEGTVELRGRMRPVSDSSHTTTKTTPAEVSTDTTYPVPTTPAVQLIPNPTQAVLSKPVPTATAEPLLTSSTQKTESTQEKTVIECRQAIRYGCKVCKEFVCYTRAESDEHLLTHMESIESMDGSMTFMCTLCRTAGHDCTSQSAQEMSEHLLEDHRFYKCVIGCDFRFESFPSIEKHAKQEHKDVQNCYCKLCNYSSALFVSLVRHSHYDHFIDWTESHSYVCCFCPMIITDSNEILDHLRQHWEQFSSFDCKSGSAFLSFACLRQHLKSYHNTKECETKLKTYSTQMFKDLKSKMLKINPKWGDDRDSRDKKYCPKCGSKYFYNEFKGHTCQGKKSNTTLPMLPMSATLASPSPTPEGHTDQPLASCSSQKSVSK